MRFQGKVAVVTGAASGIGAATARLFAREGASVAVSDIVPPQQTVEEICQAGGTAIAVECDVASSVQVKQLMDRAVQSFGRLDIVISNAGIAVGGSAETISEEDWDRCMAVNVKGGFLCAKHALPHLRRAGGGVILFTASIAGVHGLIRALPYAVSKAAVVNMARTLALDHARENIRVNAICPGATDTPLLRRASRMSMEERAAQLPMGRVVQPEDVAEGFAYLASPAAQAVTGQTLIIDAGFCAGEFVSLHD